MEVDDEFIFSQSALQDFNDCPRRFQLRCIDEVRWPAIESEPALEHEIHILRGQEFHRYLHQHAVGIPAEIIEPTIQDNELRKWWDEYLRWQSQLPAKRYPELTLTAPIGETLLMAKYDLVTRLPDDTFLIVDWKTGKAPRRNSLAERMQTLVYPYVLARAGDWLNENRVIDPQRIRMTYWFADGGHTIDFTLGEEKLRSDEQRLLSIIANISERFEFPLTHNHRHCRFCTYRSLCERGEQAGSLADMLDDDEALAVAERPSALGFDLDDIEEIAL